MVGGGSGGSRFKCSCCVIVKYITAVCGVCSKKNYFLSQESMCYYNVQ